MTPKLKQCHLVGVRERSATDTDLIELHSYKSHKVGLFFLERCRGTDIVVVGSVGGRIRQGGG